MTVPSTPHGPRSRVARRGLIGAAGAVAAGAALTSAAIAAANSKSTDSPAQMDNAVANVTRFLRTHVV